MKIRVLNASLEVIQGDITEVDVEALVTPANNHLWMGGGVAGIVKSKGGEGIEKEAVKQGPVKIGSAVMTTGGALKVRHVIHAAAMGQDLKASEESIRTSTQAGLRLAEEKGIRSLALPAIATGAGGFSPYVCAKIMLEETIEFLTNTQTVRQILFVLFDQKTYDIFKEELGKMFSSGPK
ncbi:MAG: macro domain-containing protein [Gemmatimonadota bacterium]|nr:MAG: macro domain-containing protein [Gemmatimonadota bacterium]